MCYSLHKTTKKFVSLSVADNGIFQLFTKVIMKSNSENLQDAKGVWRPEAQCWNK